MDLKSIFEIAEFLNYDATDEEFAEMFAVLGMMMNGRRISPEYDGKTIIKNMDVNSVCNMIKNILVTIQEGEVK